MLGLVPEVLVSIVGAKSLCLDPCWGGLWCLSVGFHHFFMLKASFFMEIHRTLTKFQDIDKRLTKNDKLLTIAC